MEVQRLLGESGMPINHGTVAVSLMLREGITGTVALIRQEEGIVTRINQLHSSLDQLEKRVQDKEGLLADVLALPKENLQGWQDDNTWMRLKQHISSGRSTEDNQDAKYLTQTMCAYIR